jgi:hypothetical protein
MQFRAKQQYQEQLLQLFDLFQESPVFRYTFLNVLDNAVLVDQERYPAFAVKFPDRFIFIRDKRERNVVFFGKFFMCSDAVITYTQYLGVETFKFFNILLEGLQFAFSDRSEISKVKGQHYIFHTPVIYQLDRSFVRDSLKQGCLVTNFKRSTQNRHENQKAG